MHFEGLLGELFGVLGEGLAGPRRISRTQATILYTERIHII